MLRTRVYLTSGLLSLALAGCSSGNFMVHKENVSFFITSDRPELRLVLCESGDMDRIARDSHLQETLQQSLKEKICAVHKNRKDLKALLASLDKDQLEAFMDAFRKNGYEINLVADG
ncbi:MAG: hypothetical protein FPO08_17070 [Geobacter sp.]|uniref:hypothetical protein n=1 Tax=Geomonas edaphica TaxID=2570226 RepID=UPI0010A8AECA|nr:hypothetical protein [Geomonas edaphica]TSK05212.1 MAG: hypothetical protein FPO08_17070 [Geobacter sp.]